MNEDLSGVISAAEQLLKEVLLFVEKNIVKVDVKVKEGPMMKKARKFVSKGLKNIAKLIEDPSQSITWLDVKKPKKPK